MRSIVSSGASVVAMSTLLAMSVTGCEGSMRGEPRDGGPNARGDARTSHPSSPADLVEVEDGLPANVGERFDAPADTALAAPQILYPLAGSAMPANVQPPRVQWSPLGAEGDVLRVRATRGRARATAYLRHRGGSFDHAHALSSDAFRALVEGGDGDVTLELTRWEATSERVSETRSITFRIARGSLFGAVYYWDLDDGRTMRIRPGTDDRSVVVADPPGDCMACHTVSRDGTRIWASNPGASYSYDVSRDDPELLFGAGPRDGDGMLEFASYDPSGDWVIGSAAGGGLLGGVSSLSLRDARNGTVVNATLPNSAAMFPAWSPDGTRIAFISGVDTIWFENPSRGDLDVLDVTAGTPPRLGAARSWVRAAGVRGSEGGEIIAHPTWSPDSQWLAFQHGVRAFSSFPGSPEIDPGATPAALHLVGRGAAATRRLDRATGEDSAFWPTFSPFITAEDGGRRFAWLAFFSRRDYGNARAGTAGTRQRQLWVAAIDLDQTSGDPSFAPYWLPGQDTERHNAAAYWAGEPCRPEGESCEGAGECCSSVCADDPDGTQVCQPPPPTDDCREEGERCGSDGDCCDGYSCQGNVCIGDLI